MAFAQNGTPMIPDDPAADSLGAGIALSYPWLDYPLELVVTDVLSRAGFVQIVATLPADRAVPAGWMPAALGLYYNYATIGIITAAAPAVPDSGIEGILRATGTDEGAGTTFGL
jgi:hypothetical protein